MSKLKALAGRLLEKTNRRIADDEASKATQQNAALRALRIKQGALIALVLLLTAVLPIFVSHPIGYVPLITFLLCLLISWGYLKLASKHLLVDAQEVESSSTRDKNCKLPITLKNRSKLPLFKAQVELCVCNPYGIVEENAPVTVSIDAMEDCPINASVRMGHIGNYTAGVSGIVLFDPLGLLHKSVACSQQSVLVSTPQEVDVSSLALKRLMTHQSHMPVRTVISDDVDYAGVRDYEFGDPLKSIHWKLSARSENLLTRLFETSVNSCTSVVMDFHAPAYQPEQLMDCTDAVVELALACARLVKARNTELRLCYVSAQGDSLAGDAPATGELDAFTKTLPCCGAGIDANAAAKLVARETSSRQGSDNLILCTSSLERGMVAQLNQARAKQVQVSVLLMIPRKATRHFYAEHQGLMRELEDAGIACIVVSSSKDLEVSDHD